MREVFPLSDLWKELISANSFSDVTTKFNDTLGLPKLLELYTTNSPFSQPVIQYRVTNSTNFLGWRFPLEFKVAQYRPAPQPGSPFRFAGTNGWELDFIARGTVTSIGVGAKPLIPQDILTAAGK